MLNNDRLNHIQQMEQILVQAENILNESEVLLERWQQLMPDIERLENYYYDADWQADYAAYEQGEIPKQMPCGVLSEDAVFNVSAGKRSMAIAMMKIAVRLLEGQPDEAK